MKVAVTGASGHVGAALVRELLARGHAVRAIARSDKRALEGLDVEVRTLDVTDAAAVEGAIAGVDWVFHAAARVSLEAGPDPVAEATNVEGTRNVVAACERVGIRRLVHFSSSHAMRAEEGGAAPAQAEVRVYERSKAEAERLVVAAAERGVPAVIVSPCAVLGPHDFKPSYLGRVLTLAARWGVPAVVPGGQSWVDVRDIAGSAIAAAERGTPGARYVLGGHWKPIGELLSETCRIAGALRPLGTIPAGLVRPFAPLAERVARARGADPILSRASLDALEHEPRPLDPAASADLGHAPRPLEETLRDTLAFFEARGQLPARRSKG